MYMYVVNAIGSWEYSQHGSKTFRYGTIFVWKQFFDSLILALLIFIFFIKLFEVD